MNYEEKYKYAIEQAKKELEACGSLDCDAARQIFRLFPELKKSGDKLMREGLIDFLKGFKDTTVVSKWIEWLEKNSIFDMPKIEFKVGDWVIFKHGAPSVYRVEKLEDYEYTLEHLLGGSIPLPFGSQNIIRPWTILDAKDGDILEFEDHGKLVTGIISFVNRASKKVDVYCLLEEGEFKMGAFYNLDTINPHPITVEQRNLFFEKMQEEGYKCDDISKKLIRYER